MLTTFEVSSTEYTVTKIKPFVFRAIDDMDNIRLSYLEFVSNELKGLQDYIKSTLITTEMSLDDYNIIQQEPKQ